MEEEMEDGRMNDAHHRFHDAKLNGRDDKAGSEAATTTTTPQHQKSNGRIQPDLSSENASAGVVGSPPSQSAEPGSSGASRHRDSRLSQDGHDEAYHEERLSREHREKPNKKKQRVKSSGGFLLDTGSFSKSLRNASGFRIRSRGSDIKGKKRAVEAGNQLETEKTRNGRIISSDENGELKNDKSGIGDGNSSARIRAQADVKSEIHDKSRGERQESAEGDRTTHQSPNHPVEQQQQQQHQNLLRPPAIQINPTDIVNMALSLSESRRRQASAGSYYLSTPSPPSASTPPMSSNARNFSPVGLAPPVIDNRHSFRDYSAGGSLRQHLQQQRRISRNASPELPRRPSGFRVSSMGQSADLSGSALLHQEDSVSHNYQFSAATLARAEKARNHIELGAEFRRLLQLLPPLRKASNKLYPSVSNTDRNPFTAATAFARLSGELTRASTNESEDARPESGRTYNPLQTIRNRRVRIRERQTLNPDIDSWDDVRKVRPWVEEVENTRAYANSPYHNHKASRLPEFDFMDYELRHHNTNQSLSSPDKHSRNNSLGRPRRQRMDWSVSPAELFADTYWLEQGNHKMLIEDHNGDPIVPNRKHAENESRQQSKESRRDVRLGRPGLGDSRHGLIPGNVSAVEGYDNDSDLSERPGGFSDGGAGKKRHHLSRPTLQSRFTRDRPLRRARSSSISSSEEAKVRRGTKKRSRQMPLSHHDNIGPLERHMIMVMKEEEEEEKRKMKVEREANERIEHSSAESTDRDGDPKSTLSHMMSRRSTEQNTGDSIGGSGDRLASAPKAKRTKDSWLAHTVTTSNLTSKMGTSSSSRDHQHGSLASPSAVNFGLSPPEDSSPVQVSRVRSLPIDQQNSNKSRLPKLPHLDVLTKGSSYISSHSRNEAGKLTSISTSKGYNDRQADSDTSSLRDHGFESDYGLAGKSPDNDTFKRVGSFKRDSHAGYGDVGAGAGIFDSRIRQSGRRKDNGSAVGRFLQKKTGKLGGLVRQEGGKVNQFIRRHGRHGEDGDTDGDEYPDENGDERVERAGSKTAGLGVDFIDETPEISQSDSDAMCAVESGNEMESRRKRAGGIDDFGRSNLKQRPLPTFRHTRRESLDTVSPESPQTKLYNDNLPSFKSAAAAASAAAATSARDHNREDGEDESQRSSQRTDRLAPPQPRSNRLALSKTTTADSSRSAGSRYLSQAETASVATRDASRDSRDIADIATHTAELTRSATRQSSTRLNAILAVPGSIGSGGVMPMTGLANVKASSSFRNEINRDDSRTRSLSPGKSRSQSQARPSRWSNCDVVAPDGKRYFSTAVAARALSRTETLLVCSGVKAKEVVRRAYEIQDPPSAVLARVAAELGYRRNGHEVAVPSVSKKEEYVLAANWLAEDLDVSLAEYREKAQGGTDETTGKDDGSSLNRDINSVATTISANTKGKSGLRALRARITALQTSSSSSSSSPSPSADSSATSSSPPKTISLTDLAVRVRAASSAADAIISDLSIVRRIPVRSLTDEVEGLMRARRRRLRWVRRVVFVLLEWMLLGAMWSIWSIVTVVRIGWASGRGVVRALRWFFWL